MSLYLYFPVFSCAYRKCESSQVFVKDRHTHCIDTCRPVTMCGEVVVPEDHLDVSNYPISCLSRVKPCNKYRS